MATPQRKMAAPAKAWLKRASLSLGNRSMTKVETSTTAIMVPMVTRANTAATIDTPQRLCAAAGYIRMGIRGSHGPKIKIINNTQGVTLFLPLAA